MTEPDPGTQSASETEAEKRARIMRRLGEILREDPPSIPPGGPVAAGGLEAALAGLDPGRDGLDPFNEATADLLTILLGGFDKRRKPRTE